MFNFQTCRSGIENFDGYFTCHKGDGQPPGGSYTQSCRNVNVEKGVLYADCRKVNGEWKTASLPLGRGQWRFAQIAAVCNRPDLSNIDGVLKCR